MFSTILKQSNYFLGISNNTSRWNTIAAFHNMESTGLCSERFFTIDAKNSNGKIKGCSLNFLTPVALANPFACDLWLPHTLQNQCSSLRVSLHYSDLINQ